MAILLASVMGLTFTTCVSAEAEMVEENKTDVIENLDLN